jgi:tetratricopeptide (TPR) repeat protein
MVDCMNIRKFAAIAVLVLGSVAADNVAPSKAELEAMYDKAFRAFDSNNFPEALKELDAIDARQPDLAESQNLRGVILMREGIYDKAEAALNEALRIDPKFWNARFNLAEIPFLKKDWADARKRFEEMLSSNASELQGEATQLIQYKILLTYLLEGKENMVDSILAKFELSPDTPAVHYANAAIALQRNDTKEAKNWMMTAEKNFSPQLNKLFAESLYEVGWLQKQSGQSRAALELTSASERAAKMKAFAQSRFEQAQQALQHHDLTAAQKFIDDADTADPNQARVLNLRGEILMEQKQFDQAEAEFKKSLKADPKAREAQYNLAQIPFKQKEYAKARDRFENLFTKTPGGDKNQASQLIKYKIYLTLLLEGKESRAQKMMEQFQFTGDTPALYYAQAAWEFKHNNPTKAQDWIDSARKIYSPALNIVFADAFYDLGWMQSPELATSPAPASEAAIAMESATTESSPAIEPSPIPGASVAKKESSKATAEGASQAATTAGEEATKPQEAFAAGTPAKPEEIPTSAIPNVSPVVEAPVTAEASPASSVVSAEAPAVAESSPAAVAAASATPATAVAPSRIEAPKRGFDVQEIAAFVFGLAALGIIGWLVVPEIRRRGIHMASFRRAVPANGIGGTIPVVTSVPKSMKTTPRLSGGPRQISLKLKASEPSLRRAVVPVGKVGRIGAGNGNGHGNGETTVVERHVEPKIAVPITPPEPVIEPVLEGPAFESVGEVVEQGAPLPTVQSFASEIPQMTEWSAPVPLVPEAQPAFTDFHEPLVSEPQPIAQPEPVATEPQPEPVVEQSWAEPATFVEEPWIAPAPVIAEAPPPVTDFHESLITEPYTPVEPEIEPIGQGQPIPQLTPVLESEPYRPETIEPVSQRIEVGETREPEPLSLAAVEPVFFQPTTPVTMPEPTPQPSPAVRTPSPGGAPGSMQTAVQLTFAFEIASMQLTPSFKMGAVQLRPSSKIVSMRLAGSAQAQAAMNLQVNFEISRIQPAGGSLGNVRLTPSQQQRPAPTGTPSFSVAGLQLVSDFAAAPLQLTPSTQGGQTSVLVTAPFQIATVEFSPSFEISSIVLNSNSKQVAVQLPGAPSSDGAPVFEIANLQLTGTGDIGMMQLHLVGHGPRR